jgi:hypothetical protein
MVIYGQKTGVTTYMQRLKKSSNGFEIQIDIKSRRSNVLYKTRQWGTYFASYSHRVLT